MVHLGCRDFGHARNACKIHPPLLFARPPSDSSTLMVLPCSALAIGFGSACHDLARVPAMYEGCIRPLLYLTAVDPLGRFRPERSTTSFMTWFSQQGHLSNA